MLNSDCCSKRSCGWYACKVHTNASLCIYHNCQCRRNVSNESQHKLLQIFLKLDKVPVIRGGRLCKTLDGLGMYRCRTTKERRGSWEAFEKLKWSSRWLIDQKWTRIETCSLPGWLSGVLHVQVGRCTTRAFIGVYIPLQHTRPRRTDGYVGEGTIWQLSFARTWQLNQWRGCKAYPSNWSRSQPWLVLHFNIVKTRESYRLVGYRWKSLAGISRKEVLMWSMCPRSCTSTGNGNSYQPGRC